MSAVPLPDILDRLADAGERGIPLPETRSVRDDLARLRSRGYPVRESGGRAYLERDQDALVAQWIRRELPALPWGSPTVSGFLDVGSTNDEALALARRGAAAGTLVFSDSQAAGRGRKGREWVSVAGAGLYLSMVVRPQRRIENWPLLAHVSAVALADALESLHHAIPGARPTRLDLKWPNDVLLSGRKVAGILLETTRDELGGAAAVLGVGVNVRPAAVPDVLRREAAALDQELGVRVPRRKLLVAFAAQFWRQCLRFDAGEDDAILSLWKNRSSSWNGTPVWVVDHTGRWPAVTCGLDDRGALRVCTADGRIETLVAADVTIREAAEER